MRISDWSSDVCSSDLKIDGGDWSVELQDFSHSEQHYLENTAILRTLLHDKHGGTVEQIDFAPRWRQHGRFYRPVMLMRRIRPLTGSPRVRIRLRDRKSTRLNSSH